MIEMDQEIEYRKLAQDLVESALKKGADNAQVSISKGSGFTVVVRKGLVDTLEYHDHCNLVLTVYFGDHSGTASSSNLNKTALEANLDAACYHARFTSPDPCFGLPDDHLLAYQYPDLDLLHPWNLTPQQAIELAKTCEVHAFSLDRRITHSEGACVETQVGLSVHCNSLGFIGSYQDSQHSISCTLVAQDQSGMQCDGSYTISRDPNLLQPVQHVAQEAADLTVRRLSPKRLGTLKVPVILQAKVARSLIRHFLGAISGDVLYSKSSFLLDRLGEKIFSSQIQIDEMPLIPKALGSVPFDAEGVTLQSRSLVKDGFLQGYLLDSYSGRRLGLQTTGNCGGAHNIFLKTSDQDLNQLITTMHRGLLVTELIGSGINLLTGDYSRGAVGFWVEQGRIQYPVEEITIAGNLKSMLQQIVSVANDVDPRSSILTGSILLERMTVAGS
jgi:PmbA protein